MSTSKLFSIGRAVCRNFAKGGQTWGILKRGGAQLQAASGGTLEEILKT